MRCGWKEKEYPKEYWSGNQWVGETEEDQGKDGLRTLKKNTDNGNKRVEKTVRKGRNGRKLLRRLKPTLGCNANKRRR
jgi:hypothetical protein